MYICTCSSMNKVKSMREEPITVTNRNERHRGFVRTISICFIFPVMYCNVMIMTQGYQ